jgi:hypothetical protein
MASQAQEILGSSRDGAAPENASVRSEAPCVAAILRPQPFAELCALHLTVSRPERAVVAIARPLLLRSPLSGIESRLHRLGAPFHPEKVVRFSKQDNLTAEGLVKSALTRP